MHIEVLVWKYSDKFCIRNMVKYSLLQTRIQEKMYGNIQRMYSLFINEKKDFCSFLKKNINIC